MFPNFKKQHKRSRPGKKYAAHLSNGADNFVSDNKNVYQTHGHESDERILELAQQIAVNRLAPRECVSSPAACEKYLQAKLQHLEYEVFVVIFLDVQNRIIAYEEMFRGSLSHSAVYPREVVKTALKHNCCALIIAHNHPSGDSLASSADKALTRTLVDTLKLVDIKVLDHIVVAASSTMSFAREGILPT